MLKIELTQYKYADKMITIQTHTQTEKKNTYRL